MTYLRVLFFVVLQVTLSGCYLNSTISSLDPARDLPAPPFSKITSVESVSGSSNYSLTAVTGYRVKQSAGLLLNKQLAVTPNGYRVYLHVNGRITSQE
jgi:hypothetical protein